MKIEEEIKQSKFKSPQQKAVLNLIYTANWLQSRQQDFFKSQGITATQFNILRILKGQHPNSISATEIKSRMLDRNSDVSRLLDRLAQKNLINKSTCPNDRRAADVTITKDGLSLLEKIGQRFNENGVDLNEQEATQLSDLLDKCRG
ncbi:MAG: MarR family transcriptional regulator [Cytophagia bacterium]|nr:MarR family transcriptional regulator [Cytophagia bacterium]NBW37651.1 MarR family transcriptional regulator [Cytophagia bacterium]